MKPYIAMEFEDADELSEFQSFLSVLIFSKGFFTERQKKRGSFKKLLMIAGEDPEIDSMPIADIYDLAKDYYLDTTRSYAEIKLELRIRINAEASKIDPESSPNPT